MVRDRWNRKYGNRKRKENVWSDTNERENFVRDKRKEKVLSETDEKKKFRCKVDAKESAVRHRRKRKSCQRQNVRR